MIDWVIKHLDAITDNIQRTQHTQTYEDLVYIKKVLKFILMKIVRGVGFIIISLVSFISLWVSMILLWCLFRG